MSGGQAYFIAYKACTIYMMSFGVASNGAAAQNVSFQPVSGGAFLIDATLGFLQVGQ